MYSIKAHAKVNIFLKITGHKDGYHTLISRFMRVDSLYDVLEFIPYRCEEFTIDGCDTVATQSNTIYKAYIALLEYTNNEGLAQFFKNHKVVVQKNIHSQAGLGGGSSDGAAFMRLTNQVCKLNIDTGTLAQIGSAIGADFPFFIHNYPSANVKGFGEIVEPFDEEPLNLELYTPELRCDTSIVYKTFKKYLLPHIDHASFQEWEDMDSKSILNHIHDPIKLNDLYAASLIAYPELKKLGMKGWLFSGSGSTYFKILDRQSHQ